MTMDEILENVITLAENDQSIQDTSVLAWVNMAINRINQACQCNIPVVSDMGNTKPSFDERFHESLVLFCVAKYREGDSDYTSSSYFMQQFNDMIKVMQRDMETKPSTRVGADYQQITVVDGDIYSYDLTMPFGSYFDILEVYVNDSILSPKAYTINQGNQTILFNMSRVTLATGDKITVHFEQNSDLNAPPYSWWGNSGW